MLLSSFPRSLQPSASGILWQADPSASVHLAPVNGQEQLFAGVQMELGLVCWGVLQEQGTSQCRMGQGGNWEEEGQAGGCKAKGAGSKFKPAIPSC